MDLHARDIHFFPKIPPDHDQEIPFHAAILRISKRKDVERLAEAGIHDQARAKAIVMRC